MKRPTKQIIPKHTCVANPNSMVRASSMAPVYNCRICKKLVYSNGSAVDIDDYNLHISMNLLTQDGAPVYWMLITVNKDRGTLFLGAYTTKAHAEKRMMKLASRDYKIDIVEDGDTTTLCYNVNKKLIPAFRIERIILNKKYKLEF